MQHVGGVYVLQTTQNLVHKILNMVNSKRLLAIYNTVQIGFHQILHNVYVFKLFGGRRRRYNINNANDLKDSRRETLSLRSVSVALKKTYVLMRKLLHQLNLAKDTFCVDGVFKGPRNFLDCNLLASFFIESGYHNTVCTMTNGAN